MFFVARQQDVGVDALETGKFDRIDDRPGAPVRHDARPPLIVLLLRHTELAQLVDHRQGSFPSAVGRFGIALEVAGSNPFEVRLDVDIGRLQGRQRAGDILFGQNVDHLRGNREQRTDLVGLEQGRADVDGDHDVRVATLAYFVDRHVVDQAAVDQERAAILDGGHQARHRHARAHRLAQAALAEDHLVAAHQVGRDDGRRQIQLLDLWIAILAAHQFVEEELDLLASNHTRQQICPLVIDADLRPRQVATGDVARPRIDVRSGRGIVEHVAPVGLSHGHHHLVGRQARGEGAGDQPAHARAGNAVDLHPVLTEHLEHADVRRAARAAPAEDETDARTFRRRDGAGEQGQCRQAAGHGAPGAGTAKAGRRMGGRRGGGPLYRMGDFHGVLP